MNKKTLFITLRIVGVLLCLLATAKIIGVIASTTGYIEFKGWAFVAKQSAYASFFAAVSYFLWKKAEKIKK